MAGDTSATFGGLLQQLRSRAGIRQADLAEKLGIARSTLSNIERERERASERIWGRLCLIHPEWRDALAPLFEVARQNRSFLASAAADHSNHDAEGAQPFLGGPFLIERLTLAYVFEESRSPSEIIEVRRVKALRDGAHTFGLRLGHGGSPIFGIEQQALWGGSLTTSPIRDGEGHMHHWRRVHFGRQLRIGERHEFALRSWIEQDPDPQTAICFDLTVPAREVNIHLAFHGAPQAAAVWRFGPLNDANLVPDTRPNGRRVPIAGNVSGATFRNPRIGPTYGIAWKWA